MLGMQKRNRSMVTKKSWAEFQATGLFFIINQMLHVFGWAIVYEMEGDEIVSAYPARVKYRGYSADVQAQAHKMIAEYMEQNAEFLKEETKL